MKLLIASVISITVLMIALVGVQPVAAQEARDQICKVTLNNEAAVYTEGKGCEVPGNPAATPEGLFEGPFKAIVNTLIFLVGAVSVIMLVIGGFRYTVSAGDANAVSGAKNTIIYALVGLVVAIFAFSIVNFVLNRI